MRTPRCLPAGTVEELTALLKQCRTSTEYRRVQCVWLRATLGLSAQQIATILGWHISSVSDLHSQYLREGVAALQGPGRGGRHRQNLSLVPEQELLQFGAEPGASGITDRVSLDSNNPSLGHKAFLAF
jgi:Homeodomain-like domain